MIFEIRDLKYATPATSSRAGILWISVDEGFQWRCMIQSWLSSKVSLIGSGRVGSGRVGAVGAVGAVGSLAR